MGFHAPPKDRKQLRARFIKLAKEYHPDQNTCVEADTTKRMVEITEAYKILKELLDTSGGGSRGPHARDIHSSVNAMQRRRTHGGGGDASVEEEVAASFVVPGASLSLYGFTLPWQRMSVRSKTEEAMNRLEKSMDMSFSDYVSAVRAVEKERRHREEARKRDARMSEGSHGFTAEYFEQLNEARQALHGGHRREGYEEGRTGERRGGSDSSLGRRASTSAIPLAFRFYGKRLSWALCGIPRRTWDAFRFIVFGQ